MPNKNGFFSSLTMPRHGARFSKSRAVHSNNERDGFATKVRLCLSRLKSEERRRIEKQMHRNQIWFSSLLLSLFLIVAVMAEEVAGGSGGGGGSGGEAAVHIVYTEKPEGEEPEAFHVRTLASVLGSEDAAKEAIIYSYKTAASGFSVKLTPEQVSQISKAPGVLQVVKSRTYQLHSQAQPGKLVH